MNEIAQIYDRIAGFETRAEQLQKALAARVEALEQRPAFRVVPHADAYVGLRKDADDFLKEPAASGGPKREPSSAYYPLFEHMSRAHGLTLLDSEMDEIVRVVRKMMQPAAPDAGTQEDRHATQERFNLWWDERFREMDARDLADAAFHVGGRHLEHPGQWREVALLVDRWRAQADQLIRDFPGCPKPAERAETIRHCADQLAALLPPEKAKS